MASPTSRSSGTSVEVPMKTKWCVIVLCAAAVSCSRGGGTISVAARDDTLFEGTGIGGLRIDEATLAEMQSAYGESEPSTLSTATALEFRRPPLGFWFLKPAEGDGPPRLYAVRTLLYDDCYRGKTSKGIGILDSLEAVRAAYGPPEAEYVGMNEHVHYYGQQGVIFTTQHPKEILALRSTRRRVPPPARSRPRPLTRVSSPGSWWCVRSGCWKGRRPSWRASRSSRRVPRPTSSSARSEPPALSASRGCSAAHRLSP